MKWRQRFLGFAVGVVVTLLCRGAFHLWRDLVDPTIYVKVTNSLNEPIQVQIGGYREGGFIDLGVVQKGGSVTRNLTLFDLGEGPALLRLKVGKNQRDYGLGFFLSDNGPFERYIDISPKGVAAFFYAGSKGAWVGLLDAETNSQGMQSPPVPIGSLPAPATSSASKPSE